MTPEEVVRAKLSAWATLDAGNVVAYFRDDAVVVDPMGTYQGIEEIRNTIAGYVKRMEFASLEVLNVAVNGSLVMVERMDRFIYDGKEVSAACMGVFEVDGEKIIAWRDYFDVPNQ